MHLAYVDESGNSALPPRGSQSYVLACVILEDRMWPDVFDDLIEYRRFLRANFGIPVRAELKANFLLHNGGPLRARPLGEAARFRIYRGFMRLQRQLDVKVFAVVVKKDVMQQRGPVRDPRDLAWEWLLQRFERFTTKTGTQLMVMHDEGEAARIVRAVRRARRAGTAGSALGTGTLRRPARLILDDPVSRHSEQSYLIQLADLNAYAAFRHVYPPPVRAGRLNIVPQSTWAELGDARYEPVSGLAGGPRGLVVGP
jgi:hypothetical protein